MIESQKVGSGQATKCGSCSEDVLSAMIFDLDSFAVHDGPGIRMAVYFKGCPLRCGWCHSPESQRAAAELIFVRERCALCGGCAAVCTQGVHAVSEQEHAIDWAACQACGACAVACMRRALAIKGYRVTVEELLAKAARLRPFFAQSGGGVTLTGGEVTMQADFAAALLAGLRELGIHTAIETCGACAWPELERLAAGADLILYDLKLMDDEAHRRWTGASNRQILENARRLANLGASRVQIRLPLIPGITDTVANVAAIYGFMAEVGLRSVALLPYNPAAGAKYEWLGQSYAIAGAPQARAQLEQLAALGREAGLIVEVG